MTEKFLPFYNGVFCQWTPSPFMVDGVLYSCAEQFMMARKAALFQDWSTFTRIMAADDPAEQKALGRQVRGFDPHVWNVVARDVVREGSFAKFTSSRQFFVSLMRTSGYTLVEASPTDVIWGVGLHEDDPRVHDKAQWRGANWLGEVLTSLRARLEAARTWPIAPSK